MSSHPTQFVRQYSSCSSQQIPQLSGMMELLAEIARDADIKTSLSEDQLSRPKTLREILLKEVVNSSIAQAMK
jgi:hypothetical protein